MTEHDIEDVIVTIEHPFGTVEVALTEWIRVGPGPREFVHPSAARSRLTGADLPLEVVPFRYRNNSASRHAIATGEIENPWPRT